MALRQTPLHSAHVEAGARMVDFAGWDMPVNYGSQIEEHHLVRKSAGMFDVSHMLAIDVAGSDARDFLRHVLANDVARLASAGQALYSCLLNEEGGILDDLIVYARPARTFRIVVNAGTADNDLAWLEQQRAAFDLELAPRRDLAIIAVQGPLAREKVRHACPFARRATEQLKPFEAADAGDSFIARTGYTGEDGFEIITPVGDALTLWRKLLDAGVAPAGLGARDTLRLEAGMNLYGQDMTEAETPFDCGLEWTVDLSTDRDFIGRKSLESRPRDQTRVGLVLADRGVMRSHQRVRASSGDGVITSGGFSPTMNRSIALARVPTDVKTGTSLEVELRGKWLPAQVVTPPFVRNGRVRVSAALKGSA
jgi:aminomethyltransferase